MKSKTVMFDFYYRTSEGLAKGLMGLSSTLSLREKSLVNFYVLKSQDYRESVRKNSCTHVDDIRKRLSTEFIGFSQCIKIFLKVVVHFLFIVFWKLNFKVKNINYKNILKTYVDVEYELFSEKIRGTRFLVLVLPFPLSAKRQIKHVVSMLSNKNVKVSLCGMPYSVGKLLSLFRHRNKLSVFELEFDAAKRFANILDTLSFENYLNMDDFDSFGVVINSLISNENVYIDTQLHGIGTYSPFIYTNHLKVFNEKQAEYYKKYNEIEKLSFYEEYRKSSFDVVQIEKGDCIVFYSQLTNSTLALKDIELRVLTKLSKLASKKNVKIIHKRHPNLGNDELSFLEDLKIESVVTWDRDLAINYFGCSFYSTSFYTSVEKISFLISVSEIPINLLFSERNLMVNEFEIESIFEIVNND